MSYYKSVVISAKPLITCKVRSLFLFLNYYNCLAEMNGLTEGPKSSEFTLRQNVLQSLLDPLALRNLKYTNLILRNCNLQEARFKQVFLILRGNAEKQAKMPKSYFPFVNRRIHVWKDYLHEKGFIAKVTFQHFLLSFLLTFEIRSLLKT